MSACTCRVYDAGQWTTEPGDHHTYYDALTTDGNGGAGGRLLDLDKLRARLEHLADRGYTVAVRCCCGAEFGYRRLRQRHVPQPGAYLNDVPDLLEAVAAHVSGEPGDLLELLALEVPT